MDEITRKLIDHNRRLRRALEAIRDGYKTSITFLSESTNTNSIRPLRQPRKSIALLEEVATVALEEPGNYELENTMLRRILLVYGTHELTCPKHPTFTLPLLNAEEGQVENNLELICDCSWEYIKMKLLQDTITTLQEDGSKKEIP